MFSSLEVLHGGLRINIFQYCNFCSRFFDWKIFLFLVSTVPKDQDLDPDPNSPTCLHPDSDSRIWLELDFEVYVCGLLFNFYLAVSKFTLKLVSWKGESIEFPDGVQISAYTMLFVSSVVDTISPQGLKIENRKMSVVDNDISRSGNTKR